jgi:hypothetical protein
MQTRREHKLAHLCQGDRRCRIEGVLPILLAELEEENGGGLDDNQRDEGAELLRILRKRLRVVKGSGARARPVCQSRAPPGATRVQVGRGAALTMGNESAVVCHNNGGAHPAPTPPPPPNPFGPLAYLENSQGGSVLSSLETQQVIWRLFSGV